MNLPSARRRFDGFTLIELLVVIAIISLLAAIIFPVFATVRGKARQTACLSNLKQIGLGTQMYAQDYDGLLPYARDASDVFVPEMWQAQSPACRDEMEKVGTLHALPTAAAATQRDADRFAVGILDPYLKSKEIWKCAGDTGFDVLDNNSSCGGPCPMKARPTMYERFGASYLYRTALGLNGVNVDNMTARALDGKEAGPAQINMLFDGNGSWHGSPLSIGRSGLRYITLFADGHAKLLTNDQYQEAWSTQVPGGSGGPCSL